MHHERPVEGKFRRIPLRRQIIVLVCLALLPLALWRFSADRQYWAGVWEQGTLLPETVNYSAADGAEQFQGKHGPPYFDLADANIPVDEIYSGGPPKDGIPALTSPQIISGSEASYLRADDRVIGVVAGADARAYPLRILDYHEVVNDRLGQLPIAVTYCPLCDSAAVFDRRTPLGERDFGVSGLLYNSNVLLFDRDGQPESLWSQVKTEGVSGPATGEGLTVLPLELTTWQDWLARHPETLVLSQQTGHSRDYGQSPYGGYFSSPELMFPAKPTSNKLPPKMPVLGVWTDGAARAYPESAFSQDRTQITDELEGKRFTITYNPDARSLRVAAADDGIRWIYSFWFAWYAFHPETSIGTLH